MMKRPENINISLGSIGKFQDLFRYLNNVKADAGYAEAYDEAVILARKLVDAKSKDRWQPNDFGNHMQEKYPNLPKEFIETLNRCIKNYDPVVNLPAEPLW